MKQMNLLPTEERVGKLSDFQWIILYKYIQERKNNELENYLTIIHRVLGTDVLGDDKLIPLTAFMNVDMFKELIKQREIDGEVDSDLLSEDIDLKAQQMFESDIEGAFTEEDWKKMEEYEMKKREEWERLEKIAGIKVIEKGEDIEDASD